MSDPAVEAAEVAWRRRYGNAMQITAALSAHNGGFGELAVDAAREALKPLRELHNPIDLYLWATTACERDDHRTAEDTNTGDPICLSCTENDGGPGRFCAECFDSDGNNIPWPCDTAKLIYPESELS